MQKIVHGIHKFKSESFSHDRQLFETLSRGQSPIALMITCSDSRIDPNRLTRTQPGELFIQRTAGNIVPPPSPCGTLFGKNGECRRESALKTLRQSSAKPF